MVETVLQLARAKAYNRSVVTQVKSVSKRTLHRWKKPGNLTKTATNVATSFTPPFVGMLVGWSVDTLVTKAQARLQNRRLKLSPDDYTHMKFSIKTLDVKHLDISRRKVKKCADALRQAASECVTPGKPCRKAYKLAYRYYRLENRIAKLSAEAAMLVELGREILRWTQSLEDQLREEDMERCVEETLDLQHQSCGKACFFGDQARLLPAARGQTQRRVAQIPSFVGELTDPPDPR